MTTPQPAAVEDADSLLPGSIEQYLAVRVPVCAPDARAGDVRLALHGHHYESVADVAVCVGTRLVGLVPAERLLSAADDCPASELMDADPPVVAPGLAQEEAAWKAVHHGESSLAVVDEDGTFRGLVPPARLLGVLLAEHDEDVFRLAGVISSQATARHASEAPLGERIRLRAPWLVVGLLGSGLAALLMDRFETQLAADVRLAFFIPGVVYMADAIGTQTVALAIRGQSVGITIRSMFRLELFTGLALGVLVALVSLPAVWWAMGSFDLALAVSIALMAACAVATVVAMALPWLMTRAGRDPAYGSGPLATVLQDLLSLLIYFVVAALLLGGA